jgi:hypothetical protein
MDKFMMMPKGFMGLPMEEEFISTAENKKNTQIVIDDWMLGPENPSNASARHGKNVNLKWKIDQMSKCGKIESLSLSGHQQLTLNRSCT